MVEKNPSDLKGKNIRLWGWYVIFALEEFQEENGVLS